MRSCSSRPKAKRYLVDVGFGGNVATGPLVLKSRDEQTTPHEPFRLVAEDHRLVVEAKIGGQWTRLYAFDLAESIPADFEMGNWFTSAHPESIFVNGLLARAPSPAAAMRSSTTALSVHKLNGGTEKKALGSAAELRDALGDLFKIRLDGLDGLDTTLARLAAGTA